MGSAAGATNIKVASVADFVAGQAISIGTGPDGESAVISSVGTAGATTVSAATESGVTVIPVASPMGFSAGETITVDDGADRETAVVESVRFARGGAGITVNKPLTKAHAAGAQVSGSGITLSTALGHAHVKGTPVERNAPTPGAPNKYDSKH